LLGRLIETFDRDSKVEEAWLDEALRREQEVLSGRVKLVPGNAAVARIRSQLLRGCASETRAQLLSKTRLTFERYL